MRLKISYPVMILLATVFLSSCNAFDTAVNSNNGIANNPSPGPTANHAEDDVRRITTAELDALMKEGKAYVVDVRNQDAFDLGHIPGSKLIPAGLILNYVDKLPRDKTIVTYCS